MMQRSDKFWMFLVKFIPRKLKLFCAIHILAYATTGKYGKTVVPELTALEAIDRYFHDKIEKEEYNRSYGFTDTDSHPDRQGD
jgi:hypothetical protein